MRRIKGDSSGLGQGNILPTALLPSAAAPFSPPPFYSANVPGSRSIPFTFPFAYSTDIDPQVEFDQATEFFERPVPPEPAGPANQRTSFQTFLFPGVIPLPAVGAPDAVILSFKVPSNWDGWITQVANSFNGPGFVPGSGDIVWRILQNGQAVRDFDNIQVLLGIYSPGGGVAPLRLEDPGIPIYADDTIQLVVSNVNTVAAASQVYGFLGGKRFPRGGGWGVSWWS
jgi:hypothetical protein